jgi:uncharacterized damage-inducible protein DinB
MSVREELLTEFHEELATTRRVLDRIPADKLTWKPHEKSWLLGQLAMHIALVPGAIATITSGESFDVLKGNFTPPTPKSKADISAAMEQSAATVEEMLKKSTDEVAYGQWRLLRGDQLVFAIPRVMAWRKLMLNHWYHHRGQLSVYLRLCNVPVPAIYGPSLDENPFELDSEPVGAGRSQR